tara:strand:+ start:431 stop:559 length:129 start_codon:yes stop_codon:yes gene_type:complete
MVVILQNSKFKGYEYDGELKNNLQEHYNKMKKVAEEQKEESN